jgi:hypothetical protein
MFLLISQLMTYKQEHNIIYDLHLLGGVYLYAGSHG